MKDLWLVLVVRSSMTGSSGSALGKQQAFRVLVTRQHRLGNPNSCLFVCGSGRNVAWTVPQNVKPTLQFMFAFFLFCKGIEIQLDIQHGAALIWHSYVVSAVHVSWRTR